MSLLLLLVPLLGLIALALRRPAYEPKFLLLALPGLALLVGQGVASMSSYRFRIGPRAGHAGHPLSLGAGTARALLAALPLLLLAPATIGSLSSYYYDPRYARDDYRGIAARIAGAARPGDGVVLLAPSQVEVFGLYYRGPLPVYPLPLQRPLDPADTRARLAAIERDHQRLWLVLWAQRQADPDDLILTWLNERAFPTEDTWYGGVRLLRYALAGAVAEPAVPIDLRLENGADLVGYTLLTDEVEPGDAVRLALFWRAREPITARYKVFTQLLDGRDFIVGQRDAEPVADRRPTPTWGPGELIVDNYGIPVRPGTPPGEYRVIVGMYAVEGGKRPGVRDGGGADKGSFVPLGSVRVRRPASPPDPAALGITHVVGRELQPGVTLLGYDLHPVGADPKEPPRPGEPAQLTLSWRADRTPDRDFQVRVELVDASGRVRVSQTSAPGSDFPPARWQAGDVLRDPRLLPLTDLPHGRYELRLQALGLDGGPLGPPTVLDSIQL